MYVLVLCGIGIVNVLTLWSLIKVSEKRFIKRNDDLNSIRIKLALLQFIAIEIWLNSRENDE